MANVPAHHFRIDLHGLDRAQQYLRRYPYYLKTDIVRFFPNVDHEVLQAVLCRRIADQRLLELIQRIIASGEGVLRDEATETFFPGDDLFALLRPRGLPIGNLTSQFFANVLLDPMDHFIKEELRVPGYVRYADDLVLFGESKAELWRWRDALARRLETLRLRLHAGKTQVRPCRAGLKFLGMVLAREGRRLPQSALIGFNRQMRSLKWQFARGRIDAPGITRRLEAWYAHVRGTNSQGITRLLARRIRFGRKRVGAALHKPAPVLLRGHCTSAPRQPARRRSVSSFTSCGFSPATFTFSAGSD